MFYERFIHLCNQKGVSPSRAALDAGISKSLVTKWKTNCVEVPSPEVIRKLARYFNIPVSELIDEQTASDKILVNENDELTEFVQMLKTRPECRMLFQLSKNATREDVEAAVRIIEAIRNR